MPDLTDAVREMAAKAEYRPEETLFIRSALVAMLGTITEMENAYTFERTHGSIGYAATMAANREKLKKNAHALADYLDAADNKQEDVPPEGVPEELAPYLDPVVADILTYAQRRKTQ